MFLLTPPIVINVPTRGLMAVETMKAIVQRLENLNIKRNVTSMFVNKKHCYMELTPLNIFEANIPDLFVFSTERIQNFRIK